MHYVSVSFTHKNTDIAIREKLSFMQNDRKKEILRIIGANENILESMVLSTCNRVEIFAYVLDPEVSIRHILNSISILTLVPIGALELRADIYEDQGAIHHLFAVASSLDSLVIGETQIAGQLKDAFKFAHSNEDCGVNISNAVHFAFKCAAEVRALTQISKNPVSVSSVAVAKAKEICGNIGGMTAIVIGVGEMSKLACKHLINAEVNVIILNRNVQKAKDLSQSLGDLVRYDSIEKLGEYINRYKLIFSATGALDPIITDKILEPRDFHRYFFDIAVPRDIDICEDELTHVYAVDDLEEIVKTNLALREEQAGMAYLVIGRSTTAFFKWLISKSSTPAIKALRLRAKQIACEEIDKAIKRGYLKNSDKQEAKKLIHQVFKAFLHLPSVRLKEQSNEAMLSNLEYLFDIKINKDDNLGEI